jgi:hypothetical protein
LADPQQKVAVSELLDRHRRDLAERTDISQAMRKLSQSSGRNPMGPPKRKPRSLGLTLLVGIPAAVAMVVCVATAAMVLVGNLWLVNQLNDPSTTVQKYYAALGEHNYGAAYSYFTARYKAAVPESSFTSKWSLYASVDGDVSSYAVTKSDVGDSTASITVTVIRRVPDTAQLQTIKLVKVNNNWLIDNITAPTSVPTTPVATASS